MSPSIAFEKPEFTLQADTYIYAWHSWGIGIGLENFRQSSEGLKAEMTVLGTNGQGHQRPIDAMVFNMLSPTAQATAVKSLATENPDLPWADMLKYVRLHAKRERDKGEPIVDLSTVEDPGRTEYLIDYLLPKEESTVVFADGGSGKSFIASAMALAVTLGLRLPGGIAVNDPGPVVYLDWETHHKEARRRLSWLCRGWGIEKVPQVYYRAMRRPLADEINQVRKQVEAIKPKLVIVDSLAVATASDSLGMKGVGGTLESFSCLRFLDSSTRLVIGHISADGARQKGGAGRLYGNVFGQNAPRSVWELRSTSSLTPRGIYEVNLSLWHRKTNVSQYHDPIGWRLAFDDAAMKVTLEAAAIEDSPELVAHGSLSFQIRALLKEGPKDASALARETGAKEKVIVGTINRMADVVNISEAKRGRGHTAVYAIGTDREDQDAISF